MQSRCSRLVTATGLGRFAAVAIASVLPLLAHGACDRPVARLLSAQGLVEVRAAGGGDWQAIALQHPLCEGDQIAVRAPGRAAVQMNDGTLVRLDQHTTLNLLPSKAEDGSELGLIDGIIHIITRLRRHFGVTTPFVNAMVEGTEFSVSSDAARARVVVDSGRVRTENPGGSVVLPAGAAIEAEAGQPPREIQVRPLDALRWAIHYPQIVWHGEHQLAALAPAERRALTAAQRRMAAADYAAALSALPDDAHAAPALAATRIALLLSLGNVDLARRELARPAAAGGATLEALDAVVRVALGDAQAALQTARQAVERDPGSGAARLALSYARQAGGKADEALEAAREACRLAPQNPFAWARRAELELSLGLTSEARQSLERATALAPALPRAKALQAFADLIEGATDEALQGFDGALEADANDPLAYFGRGLARIRGGDFSTGRLDIERAVLLDPGNAELRAYLARAYVEERRSPLAGKELELARRLDPASPTPWQFDALRKLRDNDPVGALADGRRAIALNDNRVVVRTPRLLDIDRAARSANLGPAYSALGFRHSLRVAADDAVADDPSSAAGHRLLADAYAESPRNEAARVGELLQARMREPIGRAPRPPQFDTRGLPLVGGPRALAPEDPSELFERGPSHLFASAQLGTQSTRGASVLAARSGARGQLALGHFRYHRDAFAASRDIDLSATRFDWRLAAAPGTVLAGEFSSSDRRGGETVPQLLDGVALMPVRLDQQVQRDTARVWLRHAARPDTELIVTAALQGVREKTFDRVEPASGFPFELFETRFSTRLHARELGLLLVRQRAGYDVLAGAATYRQDRRTESAPTECCTLAPVPLSLPPITDRLDTEHNKLFVNLALAPAEWAQLLLGASYDTLDSPGAAGVERLGGKIGTRLQLDHSTTASLAMVQGVKGPKYREQALEPTRFAGFNQLFDDFEGTRWRLHAAGIDHRFANGGGVGARATRRRLDVPGLGCVAGGACLAEWDDRVHQAYLEWPFGPRLAASASWQFERLKFDGDRASLSTLPYYVRTELLPLGLWLKPARHWALRLEALRVRQRASLVDLFAGGESRSSNRWLANARIDFVGKARRIEASLAIHNLFDRALAFQNTDINGDPRVPLFYAERSLVLQASVRF